MYRQFVPKHLWTRMPSSTVATGVKITNNETGPNGFSVDSKLNRNLFFVILHLFSFFQSCFLTTHSSPSYGLLSHYHDKRFSIHSWTHDVEAGYSKFISWFRFYFDFNGFRPISLFLFSVCVSISFFFLFIPPSLLSLPLSLPPCRYFANAKITWPRHRHEQSTYTVSNVRCTWRWSQIREGRALRSSTGLWVSSSDNDAN